jgi:hypothetical protein
LHADVAQSRAEHAQACIRAGKQLIQAAVFGSLDQLQIGFHIIGSQECHAFPGCLISAAHPMRKSAKVQYNTLQAHTGAYAINRGHTWRLGRLQQLLHGKT